MRLTDYYRAVALSLMGFENDVSPDEHDSLVFVNDVDDVYEYGLVEKLNWYSGESWRLYQFYNYSEMVQNRTDPYGYKPNRSYFWAVASQDNEFKLVHSGFARDAIDTITAICMGGKKKAAVPKVAGGVAERVIGEGAFVRSAEAVLNDFMDKKDVWGLVSLQQMPLTLALGWGMFKISFDKKRFGAVPLLSFYKATQCRIYQMAGEDMGYLFIDFFSDAKGARYACVELRKRESLSNWTFITEIYAVTGDNLTQLDDAMCVEKKLAYRPSVVKDMPLPLAVPSVFYSDPFGKFVGRSPLDGRIDILDGIDECLSIAENCGRRSMPIELFNSEFFDIDKETLMPKKPKTFERKYIFVKGQTSIDGETKASLPVQVSQPKLDFTSYKDMADYLKCCFLDGFLSPATFGINWSANESEGMQKEKEKQTTFTKNVLQAREKPILESVLNQVLATYEYLLTGKFSTLDFGVTVTFDEMANVPFESKLQSLSNALANNAMSPEMFVDKMYGDEISNEDRQREIDWITEKNKSPVPPKGEGSGEEEILDEPVGDALMDEAVQTPEGAVQN